KARRYQSAAEVRADLEKIERGIPTTERVVPERRTITSREITVKFTPRKLFLPALGLLALVIVVVLGVKLLPRKEASFPPGGKPVLAVMYFKNNTGEKAYDVWREGLPTLLITGLSQSKYLNVLSANDIYGILKKTDLLEAANYAPEDLEKVAAAGRANHTVTGSLSKAGDVFRIDYSVQDLGRGKTVGSGSVGGTGENSILISLGDDLVRKIKADLNLSAREIAADIEKGIGTITTSSAEAFKLYLEGRRLHTNMRYRDSIAEMEKALALDPEFAMAYRSIAVSYSNLGYPARRLEYMEKALQYADRLSDSERLLIQSQYALSQKNRAEAIEYLQKGLSLYPDNEDFSVGLGNQWIGLEEFAKAAEVLERPRMNRSANFLVYTNLAGAYAGLNDYDRAVGVLRDFIDNVEDIVPARLRISNFYIDCGKLDLALAELERAAALDPRDRNCGLLKSQILLYKNDFPAAEQELRPLLDASEPEIERAAIINLGCLDMTLGRFRKAVELSERVAALTEKSGEKIWEIQAKMLLSYLYGMAAKDYQRALKLTDEILRFAVANNNLAWRQNALFVRAMELAMTGSFPEALKAAEEIRGLFEGDLNKKLIRFYLAAMGKIELERNDLAQAIKYAEDSLALFPFGDLTKPAWIYDTLAQAYFRSGDMEKARATYEKISTLTSGRVRNGDVYARSFYWLGKIHEKLGDMPKAREDYRRFFDLWKDADPGLPEVEDARKRLAGLTGS
ncbi:MAG TPA: tetratricopeptide repeat protein, partial [Acidobacteriota bacterium]|nr:tetratricopeptide repeat protein [Acidobacteriota bacterium]